ncbi:lipid A biosynthesis lauroyl acyltransferase [Jeongeupia naejangsanensis]|uniref:Lipid A biosynthesis lauroyl acyltransferase n=1 Tax=Jeongeupia naejangsanensis TaxID=613195 RepID=A0ABS2BLZ5_9NEIS|nr:lipid A biosynthesis lauroyl acyltransferase [Jeongeupia naejangsanensis]MBM3116636.1 lipid A biosynthesis lauroyl acyltransferase [Jeongeupia naejangsanensis]
MKRKVGFFFSVGLLRLLACLPYGVVARIGHALGLLLYRLPTSRKRVVHVNLRLCFPDMDDAEREVLARAHICQVIRSYLERGFQWFGDARKMAQLIELDSAIDLHDPAAPPTIFMGFHFVAIEAGSMRYSSRHPVASLYTPMSNRDFDGLARTQRGRFGAEMISRADSARASLECLRRGVPVMLAADMDFGVTNSAFVPFFGVQACTLTSVSRLAKLSGARVVPFVTEVLPDFRGYKLNIFAPLADYPSGDAVADARTMNAFLETQVRRLPEQYYWVHKRFKHRPEGEAPVY